MHPLPRTTARLAVALAAILSLAGLAAPAQAAVTTRPIRVMPLGDSITWGEGSPTTSSYRAPPAPPPGSTPTSPTWCCCTSAPTT